MTFVLAGILFIAFGVQATAGFGSVLLSLAIGALFWPISELLPIVVSLSLMLSTYIGIRYRRHVEFRVLLRSVLPLMGAGVVIGILLAPHASPRALRLLLGVIVSAAALRGLYALFTGKRTGAKGGGLSAYLWVIFAGVLHGLIATGGPALVYAIESMGLGKSSFRSSLAFVWIVLNGILVVRFVATGALGEPQLGRLAMMVPVVVASTLLGEILHSRVSEKVFRAVVFLLLAAAGMLLCVPLLLG
jgi:uncharacterized membrane protein YfcA